MFSQKDLIKLLKEKSFSSTAKDLREELNSFFLICVIA